MARKPQMRISQAIIKFETELGKDESLREIVGRLKEDLNKQAKKN